MAEFGDSLVIRILADSSELQRELNDVAGRFDELHRRVDAVNESQQQLDRLGTALNTAVAPLQRLSQLFDQVQRQADTLGRTTVSLDVGPALNALSNLSAAIGNVQAQLAALRAPVVPMLPGLIPLPAPNPAGPIRQFADGGPVEGPPGIDQVPAMLTAGEFVLNREAVRQLGVPFLQQLNAQPAAAPSGMNRDSTSADSTTITTHFGGVTIQVQQPAEVSSLFDALQLEAQRLRTRRG